MRDLKTERCWFICLLRFLSTAMWVILWFSASSSFLQTLGFLLRRFFPLLADGGCRDAGSWGDISGIVFLEVMMSFSGDGSRSRRDLNGVGERDSESKKFKRPFDDKASSVIALYNVLFLIELLSTIDLYIDIPNFYLLSFAQKITNIDFIKKLWAKTTYSEKKNGND